MHFWFYSIPSVRITSKETREESSALQKAQRFSSDPKGQFALKMLEKVKRNETAATFTIYFFQFHGQQIKPTSALKLFRIMTYFFNKNKKCCFKQDCS